MDIYDVYWSEASRKYVVRHGKLRSGRELRWEHRDGIEFRAFAVVIENYRAGVAARPNVTMASYNSYAVASVAARDGTFPLGGPFRAIEDAS